MGCVCRWQCGGAGSGIPNCGKIRFLLLVYVSYAANEKPLMPLIALLCWIFHRALIFHGCAESAAHRLNPDVFLGGAALHMSVLERGGKFSVASREMPVLKPCDITAVKHLQRSCCGWWYLSLPLGQRTVGCKFLLPTRHAMDMLLISKVSNATTTLPTVPIQAVGYDGYDRYLDPPA